MDTKKPNVAFTLVKTIWLVFVLGLVGRGLWEAGRLGWQLLDYLR